MKTLEELIDQINGILPDEFGDYDERQIALISKDLREFIMSNPSNKTNIDHRGATILHAICSHDFLKDWVGILVKIGADFNIHDKDGDTPFIKAAKNSSTSIIEELSLIKKINHYEKNNDGLDAIACAAISNNQSTLESLIMMLDESDELESSREEALTLLAMKLSRDKEYKIDKKIMELLSTPLKELREDDESYGEGLEAVAGAGVGNGFFAIDFLSQVPTDMMDSDEMNDALTRWSASDTAYIDITASSLAVSDATRIRKKLEKAMKDDSKKKLIIGAEIKGHFTGFFIDKKIATRESFPQISYFDPAPQLKKYHMVPGNLLAVIAEYFPRANICRSESEMQPARIIMSGEEKVPIIGNNYCGRLTWFVLTGMALGKIAIGEDNKLELRDDEVIYKIDALSPKQSLDAGELILTYLDLFTGGDKDKPEFYQEVFDKFLDMVFERRAGIDALLKAANVDVDGGRGEEPSEKMRPYKRVRVSDEEIKGGEIQAPAR